jgi:hypothetical protein
LEFAAPDLQSMFKKPSSATASRIVVDGHTFRLLLLTIALIAVAIAYVRISGVGIPPYQGHGHQAQPGDAAVLK